MQLYLYFNNEVKMYLLLQSIDARNHYVMVINCSTFHVQSY